MRGLRLGGVPLHPLLVHFPVVAWVALPLLDAAAWLGATAQIAPVAAWIAGLGVLTGLLAMGAGLFDLAALEGEPKLALATRHMLWMSSAWSVALIALLLRLKPPGAGGPPVVYALDALVLIALSVGGHLGATLVYRHGAGVSSAEPAAGG